MKKYIILLLVLITINSFSQNKKTFADEALLETFISFEGEKVQFKQILDLHKGKTIFIDIWASWCHDCVGSIPKFKALQKQEPKLVYIMLSHDKTEDAWKEGVDKYNLKADHYMFTKKWKESPFCKSIKLDWIPRYMLVGKDGTIKVFKAIELDDEKLLKSISIDK